MGISHKGKLPRLWSVVSYWRLTRPHDPGPRKTWKGMDEFDIKFKRMSLWWRVGQGSKWTTLIMHRIILYIWIMWIFDHICSVYHTNAFAYCISSVIWSAALLLLQAALQAALVADWSCQRTSTEINVCIKDQWSCESRSRVQAWKQTAWFLIGLTIITFCRLCHGDWYYSGGSITCLVVPLPLKSEGAGGREIVIAENTCFNVLKPWGWSYSQQLEAICVYISSCIGSTYPHAAGVAWLECSRLTSNV